MAAHEDQDRGKLERIRLSGKFANITVCSLSEACLAAFAITLLRYPFEHSSEYELLEYSLHLFPIENG